MWTSLAIAALALAPAQAGKLALTNPKPTYGMLGAPRPGNKFIPGDEVFLSFDIENLKIDEVGRAKYSIGMVVKDSKGGKVFEQEEDPKRLTTLDNYFGGNRIPIVSYVDLKLDQAPGSYTMEVTVTDRTTKSQAKLEHKFELAPADFGVVRLNCSSDAAQQLPAPMLGVAGQITFVNFLLVGFDRNEKKKSDLSVAMRFLDENGKPTLDKPISGNFEVPEGRRHLPVQFRLALTRPGKFTIEINATDNVSKKKKTLSFPFVVLNNTGK